MSALVLSWLFWKPVIRHLSRTFYFCTHVCRTFPLELRYQSRCFVNKISDYCCENSINIASIFRRSFYKIRKSFENIDSLFFQIYPIYSLNKPHVIKKINEQKHDNHKKLEWTFEEFFWSVFLRYSNWM